MPSREVAWLEQAREAGGLPLRYAGKALSLVNNVLTHDGALHLTAGSQLYRHDLQTGKLLGRHNLSAARLGFALDGLVAHGGLLWSMSWDSGCVFALHPETADVVFEQKIAQQKSLSTVRLVGSLLCAMRNAGSLNEPLGFNLDTRTLHMFPVHPVRYDHGFQFAGVRNGQCVALVGEGLRSHHFPDEADGLVRIFDAGSLQPVDTGQLADIWEQPAQWHHSFDTPIVVQAEDKAPAGEFRTLLLDRSGATRIPGYLYRFSNTWQLGGERGHRFLVLNDQLIHETSPDAWQRLPALPEELALPTDALPELPPHTTRLDVDCESDHLSLNPHPGGGWRVSVPLRLRCVDRRGNSSPHGSGLVHYHVTADGQCTPEPQVWLTNPMNNAVRSSGLGPRVKDIGRWRVVYAPGRYYLLDAGQAGR
jgi:hypothetical protein